jgi:DNA-binding IclR family transcriptional regulator
MNHQHRRALADQTELATAAILALAPNVTKTFGDLVRELKASQSALAAVIVELTTDGWLTRNHINGRFVLTLRGAEMVTAAANRQRGRSQARRAAQPSTHHQQTERFLKNERSF